MDRNAIRDAAIAPEKIETRIALAKLTADVFHDVGTVLHLTGHIVGNDRQAGLSPFGHGDDATVAIALLLRIGSELVFGSTGLIASGRHYAGSALIRQLVEVEYLAWAFEENNSEAARWLRSTHDERHNFFTPAKLRKAAGTRFRPLDYGYHCELGGHPVPGSWRLLHGDVAIAQMMLSDCLGHAGRAWDHVVGWARNNHAGHSILARSHEMTVQYTNWKDTDLLTQLPPPPEFPEGW